MNDPTQARGTVSRLPGVIDTLSAGYAVVNRRPWIIVIPMLLDLFFWLGPQVSVAPLIGQVVSGPLIQRALAQGNPEAIESVRQTMLNAADELNLLSLLSPGWVSVPTVMPALGAGRGALAFVDSAGVALLIALVALVGGALLGCLYRSLIAQQVRDQAITPGQVPRDTVVSWLRLLGLAILLLGLALLFVIPSALLVAGASLFSRELGSFGMAMVMTMLLWVQLYLFFAPDAIFVSRVGPKNAIRRSVAVVRANFWAAIRIILLMTIILLGMGQVWIAVANRVPWGHALGILGNAYIASGLVAASMLFYRERVAALPVRQVAAAREV